MLVYRCIRVSTVGTEYHLVDLWVHEVRARVRALTKPSTRLEAHARGVVLNVVAAVDAHIAACIDILRVYPPPKPDGKYVRTGNLRDAWEPGQTTVSNSGIRSTVVNNMRYAAFVHGDEQGIGQQGPPWHAPGWPLMAEVLRTGFNDRIKKAMRDT